MRQEYSAGSAGFILESLPRCTTQCHQTRSYPAPAAPAPEDEEALEARVDEALAGNQELQSYVHRLDSGLVDEDQEPPNELNYLTKDDLPNEIPSSDVVLHEFKGFLRQNQQDPGPNSGSDDPSDSA